MLLVTVEAPQVQFEDKASAGCHGLFGFSAVALQPATSTESNELHSSQGSKPYSATKAFLT